MKFVKLFEQFLNEKISLTTDNKYLDLKGEIEEIERVSQDLSRNKGINIAVEMIVEAFKKAKEEVIPDQVWAELENTESNQIKAGQWDLVYKVANAYNKSNPEKLKAKFESGGNTRLCTAAAMGIKPLVFIAKINKI
jgi:hypothetical protein